MGDVQLFKVEQRDDFGDVTRELGTLSCDAHGALAVAGADAIFGPVLSEIVQAVNGQDSLRTKVPPSPGAAPNSVFWRNVRRDDPDLAMMLGDYIEQKYGLYLVPVAAAAAQ